MQFTLLLSLVALTLAGYAVDFNPTESRDAGSAFWLEDGSWEAVVTGRTDLNTSFLEVHLFPTDVNMDCWWSLWSDATQVTSGVFRSATSSVVTVLSGTIPNGGETLTITTSGCWVGRYATPYQLGDNDGGVFLVDVTPETQEALWTVNQISTPITNELDSLSYRSQLLSLVPGQGLCRFNNQACNQAVYAEASLTQGYWVLSSGAAFLVTWDASTIIAPTDEVLIETSSWYQNAQGTIYFLCNSSLTCDDAFDPDWAIDTIYQNALNLNTLASDWSQNGPKKRYVGPDPLFNSYESSTMNSTRNFARTNFAFTPSADLFSGVVVSPGAGSIVFPYVKVWGLNGNYSAEPIHQIIDLRGLQGSACEEQDTVNSNINFYSSTNFGYPNYGCSVAFGPGSVFSAQANGLIPLGQPDQSNWFWCGQTPTLFGTNPTSANCGNLDAWSDLDTTTQVTTAAMDISNYIFPNGGFITPVLFDLGVPCVYSAECPAQSALNQLSYFDIEFDGTLVGSTRQFFVDNFDSNQIRGDGVGGFVFGASPATLQYRSAASFSIVATSFLPATAFPTPLCDPANCLNGGYCGSDFVADCTCQVPWTGATCDQRVDLCPTDSSIVCFNGGVCGNNPDAQYSVAVVDGVQAPVFSNLFLCDCTNTARVNGTGDFYGDLCQYAPPCDNKPCFNGGVCQNGGQDQFTCDCSLTLSPNSSLPYTGTLCETSQTTTCDINPCENGGTCDFDPATALASGYLCTCTGGWTGPTCAIPPTDRCQPSTCQPFGVCIPSSNDASSPAFTQCICLYGYSGDACDQAPTGCAADTCENGGSCVGFYGAGASEINCLCPHPWVGQHCQWNSTAYNTATSQAAGLFVVLIALFAALI